MSMYLKLLPFPIKICLVEIFTRAIPGSSLVYPDRARNLILPISFLDGIIKDGSSFSPSQAQISKKI